MFVRYQVKSTSKLGKLQFAFRHRAHIIGSYVEQPIPSQCSNKDPLAYPSIMMTSNWARATRTCEVLKLENIDEDGYYVQLFFYDKLSSLIPSSMSNPSMRYVRGIRFSSIRHETCMILCGNLLSPSANLQGP
jgi:hypothetical protein